MRKPKLQEYVVTAYVSHCRGTQVFTVMAASEEAAILAIHNGEGDFVSEELNPTGFETVRAVLNK